MRDAQTNGGWRSWWPAALLLTALFESAGGASVVAVSPGERGREVEAASACPTYSWSAAAGAEAYELAVFRIDGAAEPELLFTRRLEGSVTSWSPSRAECLPAGGSYGWTVRPLVAADSAEEAPWAAPLRFRVAGAPSEEEVSAALAVLARWERTPGAAAATARGAADPPAAVRARAAGRTNGSGALGALEAPIATGVAAIRGENPDTSGSAFGIFGLGHSPAGAGVVARNESAGADLILDGEANGATDTLLRQDALDRPSANPESFDFRNSGAGALTLKVDGIDVVTTATDQDTLGDLSCPAGQIVQRNAAGTGWECGVDSDQLAGLACAVGQIAEVGPGGNWVCASDDDALAALACPDGQIAKRVSGVWACAPDDTGSAGIWTSYSEGSDVRVFNAVGNRVGIGNRPMQPVGSLPSEDGALTVVHSATQPATTEYYLTMDGQGMQARSRPGLFQPQEDAPLLINRYGGGVAIGKDAPPTRAALEAQGAVSHTMAMFQRNAGGQGVALVGDWPGLYANAYWNNGVQTMSDSGYSQLINFEQSDGAIVFQTSTEPNTAADVPAATLEERLRLRKDGALYSSLTLNQFNVVPVAQITLIWVLVDDGNGALTVSEVGRWIRSAYPITLGWGSFGLNDFRLDISFDPDLPMAPVPIVAASSLDGYPPRWQGVSRDTTWSDVSVFLRDDLYGMAGSYWNFQIVIYGYN